MSDLAMTSGERRQELKLPLDPSQYHDFFSHLKDNSIHLERTFDDRRVNSVYLDTPDLQDYNDNVAGLSHRKKYRLRWYDDLLSELNLELKSKTRHVSHKSTVGLINESGEAPRKQSQLKALLETQDNGYRAKVPSRYAPVLEVRYDRKYFLIDRGIRMTIDCDIRYRSLVSAISHSFVRSPVAYVVEFKFALEDSDRARAKLQALPYRVFRHSKYVIGIDTTRVR